MAKSFYRAFLLIVSIVFLAFIFIIVDNVLMIGAGIGDHIHPYMEYAFYAIVVLLTVLFIIVPTLRVIAMPKLPAMEVGEGDPKAKVRRLARRLISSVKDEDRRAELKSAVDGSQSPVELADVVRKEVKHRMDAGRTETLKAAALSFASTAASQNSTIDTLSVLVINCKLMHKIIAATGFRPGVGQLIRIYTNVIFSAFFAHITQSGVEQGAGMMMNQFVGGIKKIPFADIVVGSMIDGTINALMTLRVGFLTISYLKRGAIGQIKDEEKKAAVKDAICALPKVVGNKAKPITEFVCKFTKSDKTSGADEINVECKVG